MANNNTPLYLLLGGGLLLFALKGKSTGSGTSSLNLTGSGSNTPIDSAGTLQADIVNGMSNYGTQVAHHPDLLNPNYQLTPAQCTQYLANYLDLRQALPGWVNTTEDGVFIPNVNAACQHHWTLYGCVQHYTYYQLLPSSSRPFQPAPPPPNQNSGGGFWSGLLSTVTTLAPIIFGSEDVRQYPKLSVAEVDILINGAAFIKELIPLYANVQPGYIEDLNNKVDELVKYYGS